MAAGLCRLAREVNCAAVASGVVVAVAALVVCNSVLSIEAGVALADGVPDPASLEPLVAARRQGAPLSRRAPFAALRRLGPPISCRLASLIQPAILAGCIGLGPGGLCLCGRGDGSGDNRRSRGRVCCKQGSRGYCRRITYVISFRRRGRRCGVSLGFGGQLWRRFHRRRRSRWRGRRLRRDGCGDRRFRLGRGGLAIRNLAVGNLNGRCWLRRSCWRDWRLLCSRRGRVGLQHQRAQHSVRIVLLRGRRGLCRRLRSIGGRRRRRRARRCCGRRLRFRLRRGCRHRLLYCTGVSDE